MDNLVTGKRKLNIDKSNWVLVKLGDLADDISKRVDNPAKSGYDRFVGLEHFNSGELKIRNWGSTENLASSAKAFKAGDILFARRNAYLRRASLVEFDGCCSGDAFVIRENQDKVFPGLLACLMNSNVLWDYANSNAAGTMSKRVKWRDLAEYQFLLPPKAEQARLAELLWAMDEVIEKEKEVLGRLEGAYYILVDNLFMKHNKDWLYVSLSEIAEINKKSLKNSHDPNYQFKYLDIASIIEPKVIGDMQVLKFENAPSRARRITSDNSIVLSLVRPYFRAFVHISKSKDIVASTGTGVVDVKDGHNSKFIFHQFFSSKFLSFCNDRMTGTNYPAITAIDLKDFQIGIPSNIESENLIADKLDSFDISITASKSRISASQSLQKSLINQIF
jgi:type I restriction enzyme, S subunit